MAITKVTRNFQITLPREVREIADIKIGDKLLVSMENSDIRIKHLSPETIIEKTFGSWKGLVKGDSVAYVKKIRAESMQRAKRMGL